MQVGAESIRQELKIPLKSHLKDLILIVLMNAFGYKCVRLQLPDEVLDVRIALTVTSIHLVADLYLPHRNALLTKICLICDAHGMLS